MDELTGVLEMIAPVVLMIAAGVVCRKKGVIQKQGILMFTLPPPFVVTIFVDDDRENASVSAMLSAYTVISLMMFVGVAYIVA